MLTQSSEQAGEHFPNKTFLGNNIIIQIRDVNSREIAFPGLDWDSQFRPSAYLLPAWSELDRRQGRKGGGSDRQPAPDAVPGRCWNPITPWIDRHSRQCCTLQEADWSPDDGPGIAARRWRIRRCRGRMGAWNGGQRPGLRRHGARVKTQAWNVMGGARSPTGPQTPSTEIHRPTIGCGRTIGRCLSGLSHFL